ncbi:MAG: Vegetative protein 296 [Chlamydiae bacterium]|nr:Vegetative protein 296 [Chlamydiota bacterium]
MIDIKDLTVTLDDTCILNGLNLKTSSGETHAIMGPNGAGKSTLAKVLAGHPSYTVKKGRALFQGQNILDLEPEERAVLGLFMSFQYPIEIPGITNFDFLYTAYLTQKEKISKTAFGRIVKDKMRLLDMDVGFLDRFVNDGFSGGEKKKNEILQMLILDPKFVILDETDSGLDIDAMKVVAKGINQFMTEQKTLLLITHYQRLLDYVEPDFVHVMLNGKIVETKDGAFAQVLEDKGYDFLK